MNMDSTSDEGSNNSAPNIANASNTATTVAIDPVLLLLKRASSVPITMDEQQQPSSSSSSSASSLSSTIVNDTATNTNSDDCVVPTDIADTSTPMVISIDNADNIDTTTGNNDITTTSTSSSSVIRLASAMVANNNQFSAMSAAAASTTATPTASPNGSSCSNSSSHSGSPFASASAASMMMHSLRSQKSSPASASISFNGFQQHRSDSPIGFAGGYGGASSSTSSMNIFGANRTRRYSTGFSSGGCLSLAGNSSPGGGGGGAGCAMPRLTPRVSQLRKEECADISNSREVSHERDVHTALQISQSWEDLSLDGADNLSVRSGGTAADGGGGMADVSNPLHVSTLGLLGLPNCSSPSPTSSRHSIRLPPYGLSPSPTRRTFATRRSMSPIAMRPSSLGPVKRKFEMDETGQYASSPPPFKKAYSERGSSPIVGQLPAGMFSNHHIQPQQTQPQQFGSQTQPQQQQQHPHYQHHPYHHSHHHLHHQSQSQFTCPSPDSTDSSGGGRSTPKLFMSKLCTNSSSSCFSSASSPSTTSAPSPSMEVQIDLQPLLHEPMQTNATDDEDRNSSGNSNSNGSSNSSSSSNNGNANRQSSDTNGSDAKCQSVAVVQGQLDAKTSETVVRIADATAAGDEKLDDGTAASSDAIGGESGDSNLSVSKCTNLAMSEDVLPDSAMQTSTATSPPAGSPV